MQYTEKELAKLIDDVEKEFTAHLAKAEEDFKLAKSDESAAAPSLAKAEEEKKPEEKKEEPKAEEKKEEKPAEEKAPEAKEAPAAEAKEAPDAEEKKEAPAKEAKAPEAPAEGEDHGYDDEDMEHMHQMYSSMSHGELKAHHDAVRKALDAKGMEKGGETPAEAPAMAKTETETSVEVKPEETQLLKSEIAAKDAKIDELKKTLDGVSEILTRLTKRSAPAGKAITSLDVVAKSESAETEVKTFTKSEITSILSKKAADPTLTKSDRDAINAYYGSNQVSIEKISHLLK